MTRGDARELVAGTRLAAGFLLLLLAGPAQAAEEGFFKGPGMEGFVKIEVYEADGDGDGEKETLVRRFRNLDGDSMFTMTTGEKLWAWSLESLQGEGIENNYVLFDSDCDGRFDRRYGLDEEFSPPDCLK
jgi:hypothetical protein